MSARLTEEEWERTLSASHLWATPVSDILRADRAAILESERDLRAVLEAVRPHIDDEWRVGENRWAFPMDTLMPQIDAAIANARKQDAP